MNSDYNIAVIGLGYVGLPLAVSFGEKYKTIGYDINKDRVNQLKDKIDFTNELTSKEISKSKKIKFSSYEKDISDANIFVITVPTPITKFRKPDLEPIFSATRLVAKYLKKGNIVIYESTVYPGCTEEDCVPILEQVSGLKYQKDFTCGYSPERIVPGDKNRTLTKIKKIVSGSDKNTIDIINSIYNSIISAGTYKAPSIKVAEAAKVIENSQRDLNIAFVNELAIIFNKMQINTKDVLEAASTKWNFLPFKPGLVGGHCIGVDPYYLAHKSESYGHYPKLILSGREINDSMASFITKQIVNKMIKNDIIIENSSILILGITFKENCPDIRNTKIIDVINNFNNFNCNVDVYDPIANKKEVKKELKINILSKEEMKKKYNAIIKLVAHDNFKEFEYKKYKNRNTVLFNLNGDWDDEEVLSL